MAKSITFTSVAVNVGDVGGQQGDRVPDLYLVFKSPRGVAGDRKEAQRDNKRPVFEGPYVLNLQGPKDPEQVSLEVWDSDLSESGSGDVLMDTMVLKLDNEDPEGRKSWALTKGGKVTLTYKIKGRDAAIVPPTESRSVTIKGLVASGLVPKDNAQGVLDPYVLLTGRSVQVQARWGTKKLEAGGKATWDDVQEFAFDPAGYRIEVWDQDEADADILLGNNEVQFPSGSPSCTVILHIGTTNTGQLDIQYTTQEQQPNPVQDADVVVRKEIRKMPHGEQVRFVNALKKLMENADGPGSSEYFRLAGYHGFPNDYCVHGEETFPGWHRGYLAEFERALIKADKALGNDGKIGLPYWDWTHEVDGQVLPKIIRDAFPTMPASLLPSSAASDDQAGQLVKLGYSRVNNDQAVRRNLARAQVTVQAQGCLTVAEFSQFASTRFNRQGTSVESPHNSVHVCVGYPMSSVPVAAFFPIFFLHHCNVDRLYEKHLALETVPNSQQEFAIRERQLAMQGESNRYLAPLDPFKHPFEDRPLMPADTFDTRKLGYVYDELPPTPPLQMREAPVYAVFKNVEVVPLKARSYTLHIFVLPVAMESSWQPPAGSTPDTYDQIQYYVGAGTIFGGKGSQCSNCQQRKPFNVLVPVDDKLLQLGLNRHDAALRVLVEDEYGQVGPLTGLPIPAPIFSGPLFADWCSTIAPAPAPETNPQVAAMQTVLANLGYYNEPVDGWYGPVTDAAIKKFQNFVGIVEGGVVGPLTKQKLQDRRKDLHSDFPPARRKDLSHNGFRFQKGEPVRYSVGPLPGYMTRFQALKDIDDAFAEWGKAMGVPFTYCKTPLTADIHVRVEDLAETGESFWGGVAVPGGQLAEASPQRLTLDAAERWLLRGQGPDEKYPKAVQWYPVLLHEIGHVIGLLHSSDPKDVMWPYYDANDPEQHFLSEADKRGAQSKVADSPDSRWSAVRQPRLVAKTLGSAGVAPKANCCELC